jgi:uncharacterized protein YecT (DUF1311 family)
MRIRKFLNLMAGLVAAIGAAITFAAELPCADVSAGARRDACEKAEIARLDAELNLAYTSALKASTRPDALRQEQRAWVWGRMSGNARSDFAAFHRFHIERIAVLRMRMAEPGIDLHDAVMGRYGRMQPLCFVSQSAKSGMECRGEAASTMTLLPVDRARARLIVDTLFFNGHSCSFDAVGIWNGEVLDFSEEGFENGEFRPGACKLKVSFMAGKLMSLDSDGGCRSACGARGSLSNGTGDPKWPVSVADLRQRGRQGWPK